MASPVFPPIAPGGAQFSRRVLAPLVITAALLTGCPSTPVPEPPPTPSEDEAPASTEEVADKRDALRPVPWEEMPLFLDDGDRSSLLEAIGRNLTYLSRVPRDRVYTYGPREVTAAELRAAFTRLAAFLKRDPSPEDLAAQIAYDFEVYRSVAAPRGGTMLFTGYYVPVIEGSLRRTREHTVPIYRHPGDVFTIDLSAFSDRFEGVKVSGLLSGNRLLPYPDRREIRESGRLRGKEIAWARDKVDLFFVEVQGSGVVVLPNGREFRIGYAGANGRQYRSIGKLLIDRGKLERGKVSMQSIRAYLAAHPEEVDDVLDYNESTVFFRKLDGPALGSLGVPVTGGRSVATDYRLFPSGALCWVETEIPAMADDGSTVSAGPLRRFMLNQDTGGAIRGTDRADFFWGRGDEAAMRAGLMKQPGELYFLAPRPAEASE